MSELVFDRAFAFTSPMTDWYRDRAFKIAFAVSIVVHAGLIAFVPGFRTVAIDTPQVLDVQIMPSEPRVVADEPLAPKKAQSTEPLPDVQPAAPELPPLVRQPEPDRQPEPVMRQPEPERAPAPVLRELHSEPPPPPRTEFTQTAPRVEPKPEFVVPAPTPRATLRAAPSQEVKPEPRIEPRLEPPPVARVQPRPEPPPAPTVEPRPEPRPEPAIAPTPREARVEIEPLPREVPPPVSTVPAVPPSAVVAPTIERPAPPEQAAVTPPVVAPQPKAAVAPPPEQAAVTPPVVAPQPKAAVAPPPKAVDASRASMLTDQYRQIISAKIKRFEDYPAVAKRRHWEGTTVVKLSISPDGKIDAISVVEKSGHEILDDAAVKMIRKAVPLPIPPEGLRTVLIPIKFRLAS